LNETLRTFRVLMETRKKVELRAAGYSMYPYIRPGDICRFEPPRHPLRKGQVALVVSPRGVLFSHRLIGLKRKNGRLVYIFRGDTNPHPDAPCVPEQVVGVLTSLVRHGKRVDERRVGRMVWSWTMVKFHLFFRVIGHLLRLADGDRETIAMHRRRMYGFRNPKGHEDGSLGGGSRRSRAGRQE